MSQFLSHAITIGDALAIVCVLMLVLVAIAVFLEIRERRWKKRIGYRDNIRNPAWGTKKQPRA